MKHKREGFTLVELMVVAVIVAILAAVAIPLMSANKTRAMATEAEAGCGTVRTALRAMYAETDAYNENLNGDEVAEIDDIPGISNGDLDGKYFSHGDYTLSDMGAETYTVTATGAEGTDVDGVVISLDQNGDWTKTIP